MSFLLEPFNPRLKLRHSGELVHVCLCTCTHLCACLQALAPLLLVSPTPDGEERSRGLGFLPELIVIDPHTTLLVYQAKKKTP